MACWQPCANLYRQCGKDRIEIFCGVSCGLSTPWACLVIAVHEWVQFLSCLAGGEDAEFRPDFRWGVTSRLLWVHLEMLCGVVPSPSCLCVLRVRGDWSLGVLS